MAALDRLSRRGGRFRTLLLHTSMAIHGTVVRGIQKSASGWRRSGRRATQLVEGRGVFMVRDSTTGHSARLRERSQPTPAAPKPIQPTVGVTAFNQLATMRTVPANQSTQQNLFIVSFAISLTPMCPPPLRRQHAHELGKGLGHAISIPRRREEGKWAFILLARSPARLGLRLPLAPCAGDLGKHCLAGYRFSAKQFRQLSCGSAASRRVKSARDGRARLQDRAGLLRRLEPWLASVSIGMLVW
jgi:hypothetical protein